MDWCSQVTIRPNHGATRTIDLHIKLFPKTSPKKTDAQENSAPDPWNIPPGKLITSPVLFQEITFLFLFSRVCSQRVWSPIFFRERILRIFQLPIFFPATKNSWCPQQRNAHALPLLRFELSEEALSMGRL